MKKTFLLSLIVLSSTLSITTSCNSLNEAEDDQELMYKVELSQNDITNINDYNKKIFEIIGNDKGNFTKEIYNQNLEELQLYTLNKKNNNLHVYSLGIQESFKFDTQEQYVQSLLKMKNKAQYDSELTIEEKKSILITIESLQSFIANTNEFYLNSSIQSKGGGWWDSWGKCAAGTLGGAMMGGLAGAAVTSPTVIGVPVGTAVGVVGGALSGAAAAC